MQKQDFKMSLYGSYKWLALDAGFFGAMIYVIIFIRQYPFNRNLFLLVILIVFILLIIATSRTLDYFSIEDNYFVIHKYFWKTSIPIKDIQVLGYRTNQINFGLTIRHEQKGMLRDKSYQVLAYEMETLQAMNSALKSINPKIQIDIDEKAEKYMKAERALIRKIPTTKIGWLSFVLKWFIVAAAVTILFFYFALRK